MIHLRYKNIKSLIMEDKQNNNHNRLYIILIVLLILSIFSIFYYKSNMKVENKPAIVGETRHIISNEELEAVAEEFKAENMSREALTDKDLEVVSTEINKEDQDKRTISDEDLIGLANKKI